jgi:4-alpha-glucanotransferase
MYNPVSTIRIQFNKDFTFRRLDELIPFFVDLGVRTIYASPVFKAVAGSMHGYDVIDPLSINPEIGSEEELIQLSQKLSAAGIGWMQDIVPNHMAFHKSNAWANDVMENGPASAYADFFDGVWSGDPFFDKDSDKAGRKYRRFFTIDDLICLNMQSQKVFDRYHELIVKLVRNGTFKGLRVDHVDGLYDPEEYLRRLRDLVGPDTYIVVEKILEPGEDLNNRWPVQGTTGYEFLAVVNNLFTWPGAENSFNDLYKQISPGKKSFEDRVIDNKRFILFNYMTGELDNLTRYFSTLKLNDGNEGLDTIRDAIGEVLVRCPVYRFYSNDQNAMDELVDECRVHRPDLAASFDQIDHAISKNKKFYKRLMQFTGPLMAKGVEDTLMYTFNRFIGHNEVGDSPDEFGASTSTFHDIMIQRLSEWPLALNATATHDTKRGEDARMRLDVLTDIAPEWSEKVRHWISINKSQLDPNDEYLIYQALISSWTGEPSAEYFERLEKYISKALREAKVNSNWESPNEEYESTVVQFAHKILDGQSEFTQSFVPFARKVADHGVVNSLSQLLLKITCPGVPDIYQGSLSWDFSFVDPDNRRPVDYNAIQSDTTKLGLTKKLLHIRNDHEKIFTHGHYRPLKVTGTHSRHVIAFGREFQGTWIVMAALVHTAQLQEQFDLSVIDWGSTVIQLPADCPMQGADLLTNKKISQNGQLEVTSLFTTLPVAAIVLKRPVTKRSAGILMPVASLPSSYAIGDIGLSARKFADFMFDSNQSTWQMLPLNELDNNNFSPYSAVSSVAGNSLLISLDDLAVDGLLNLRHKKGKSRDAINYELACNEKEQLLRQAWNNFNARKPTALVMAFDKFKEEEKNWLDGFAQFKLLSRLHNNAPWPQWPEDVRHRDQNALASLEDQHRDELQKIKWTQFIFFKQIAALRNYCNDRGISLLGDIPFYIGLNSADVWMHREVFNIDESGNAVKVSGVPPDYFNDEGQLWGMPIFNWTTSKNAVYRWWTERFRKNLKLFDYIRLDHFRAFVDYWSIPAGSKNGITGEWIKGPGLDFFEAINKELGELPFVAEDLGDVGNDVYELRDKLKLPGMKILQFGFGSDFPSSIHLPHNHNSHFVAYPGTHDNNTTRGWFDHETNDVERKNLATYFNTRVNSRNISELLVRTAYASHADSAIISIQDILNLDERSRINTPSTNEGNWVWRLKDIPGEKIARSLRELTQTFER